MKAAEIRNSKFEIRNNSQARISNLWRLLPLLVLASGLLSLSGCATTDEESSYSERPWNTPRSWETGGLPSTLNEGR